MSILIWGYAAAFAWCTCISFEGETNSAEGFGSHIPSLRGRHPKLLKVSWLVVGAAVACEV